MEPYQIAILVGIMSFIAIQLDRRFFRKPSRSSKEMEAYTKRLLQNLIPIAINLATQAEIDFGGRTGKLKRSYVINELYKLIPDEFKPYVTELNFDVILSAALDEAEEIWAQNNKIKTILKEEKK